MAKEQKELRKAVAYLRTSSQANVGREKDSEHRQRAAIGSFARHSGHKVVGEFYDMAVSGTDPIESRPGFSDLLDMIELNNINVVIVEDASRLARSVLVQELAILALRARSVRVLSANGDDLTETGDEMKVALRQIVGAFSELEKSRLVKKLRVARDRKRAMGQKVEGRKSYAERPEGALLIAAARHLHRRSPKTGKRRSLREIATDLAARGYVSASGRPLSASVVRRLVKTTSTSATT